MRHSVGDIALMVMVALVLALLLFLAGAFIPREPDGAILGVDRRMWSGIAAGLFLLGAVLSLRHDRR